MRKAENMGCNLMRTETMTITKKKETEIPVRNLSVNGSVQGQVQKFKYLGTMVNWDAKR